ncbi:unnamed protein product [Cladocopium goreaui]|uniref:Uncharacterized protein n=1 Tax=Cladocopium goreaui TaxID=2562237 RepID=A0A9P1DTD5_9DINO|nr:unnamed protein product [Cladocopium goreaui]
MRVIPGRLLHILEEGGKTRRFHGPGSGRSSCSDAWSEISRPGGPGHGTSDSEERAAYDLLHKEQGFQAFRSWYLQQLRQTQPETPDVGSARSMGSVEDAVGLCFQAVPIPGTINEYAFMDFLRLFLNCSDAEAFNFFRLLDASMLGALKFQQVYLATVLVSALSSRQLTKCLYLHSRWLFETMTVEPLQGQGGPRLLPWPRLQSLFQLLGANWIFVSRNCPLTLGFSPQTHLTHDEFVEVLFCVLAQLDKDAVAKDAQVIRPARTVKSKACTVL